MAGGGQALSRIPSHNQAPHRQGLTYTWEEPLAPLYHLSTHEVGVTRMGEDPKTSVVDIYGKSHECDRPYVIGGGQFPTYMGYNPTGTIQAMAYMTAEQLVK